jgi:hypothetical protein
MQATLTKDEKRVGDVGSVWSLPWWGVVPHRVPWLICPGPPRTHPSRALSCSDPRATDGPYLNTPLFPEAGDSEGKAMR